MARLVVYDRTSKDERRGQDVKAQAAMTAEGARARGHEVVAIYTDSDVSGDTPPRSRKGWRQVELALASGVAEGVAVREVSRVTRAEPEVAITEWRAFTSAGQRLMSLTEPHFNTVDEPDPPEGPSPMVRTFRFFSFAMAHGELEKIRSRTQAVMDEIKADRRKTESGRRPGRPSVVDKVTEEELEFCAQLVAAGRPLTQVRKALLDRRGYNEVVDPIARKKRAISYDTLARALKLRADPPQNGTLRKTRNGPRSGVLSANRSDVRTRDGGPA